MKKSNSISVVSPVYNNAEVMSPIINEIIAVLENECSEYELLLIDDASEDGSQEILKKSFSRNPKVKIKFHKTNRGTAKTYKELYAWARMEGVILFSLDGEWDPKDIALLIQKNHQYDIVIGNRKLKKYPFDRKVISFFYNIFNQVLFGVKTYDAGSIKIIKKKVLTDIPIISNGVFDEAERIIRASKKGYAIGHVNVHHFKSEKRKSIILKIPLVLEATKDMIRLWYRMQVINTI